MKNEPLFCSKVLASGGYIKHNHTQVLSDIIFAKKLNELQTNKNKNMFHK
jgi:hypothetical protein